MYEAIKAASEQISTEINRWVSLMVTFFSTDIFTCYLFLVKEREGNLQDDTNFTIVGKNP